MAGPSRFESLPNEILLEVLSYLDPKDIIVLQLGSKRLLRICRDNLFWRLRCHEESSFLEAIRRRRGLRFLDEHEPLVSAVLGAQTPDPNTSAPCTSRNDVENERIRILANWDPTFTGENVNWYNEYLQRHGPAVVNWFERPQIRDGDMRAAIEVKGAALYRPSQETAALFAVAPLDDGSVCLWDVKGSERSKKGSILSKSREGLLRLDSPVLSSRSRMASIGITECVSVDSSRNKAFFAVQSHLIEVDLQTLQIVGHQPYEWTITTISAAQPTIPLTIGTFHGIHLYDSRVQIEVKRDRQERIDEFDRLAQVLDPSPLPPYAPLAQSGPQSILHLEQPGSRELVSDDIFVAGRFASILHYDRRMFPAIKGSIHSGARLCSLASLPYPFSSLDSDLRRHGELSLDQVKKAKRASGGRTLIAGGEYNTKGSLELYGLSQSSGQGDSDYSLVQNSTFKNRQTASATKLLSVINHGTRIVYSDGDGFLKWVERDGFTTIRRHKIGHAEKVAQRSLFADMPASDEIARKILSTRTIEAGADNDVNNDDILFWTGEKLGVVGFSSQPGLSAEDFEEDARTPEEIAAEMEAQSYNERMRRALNWQANDVKFVRHLGDGIRHRV
ncbi:putative F-box domain-containing protein [Seiridium unicorne]|uniref:F-box domain-containing protein n=1 Tax=Seiridium unicorne TaxID=138068 RepID=A0ABR2UPJ5_9PEZI